MHSNHIIMQKKNQLIQFGDNMYNQFLKQIKANLAQYLNYESVVDNARFNLVDKDGKDITQKAEEFILKDKFDTSSISAILNYIFTNSIATLKYLSKNPTDGRHEYILGRVPNFADSYLSDINFALYYIDKVLGNDVSKNKDFTTKLKNLLKTKNTDLIPIYIYITGDIDKGLIDTFVAKYYTSGIDQANQNIGLIKDFIIALQQHNALAEQAENVNIKNLLKYFTENIKNQKELKEEQNKESKDTTSNIFNLDFNTIDNSNFHDFFNKLNTLSNGLLTSDYSTVENLNVEVLINDYLKKVTNEEQLKSIIALGIDDYIKTARAHDGEKFAEFLKSLKDKFKDTNKELPKTSNIRGKKMFRLAKAYTRYYIKNMLPSMLKYAGNDPEATSKVIKVSTDEIQDLMYGDTMNHPENLVEVNNPAVRDQIAYDVEQAVKGDQISGGASDGMSIEDIAKKWSEIYKQVPYEHLLEVLKTQEQAGSIVEQEHTDNLEIAKEIARDHLVEAPDYYAHLEDMEQLFPAENVSERPLPEPEGMDLQTLENPLPKNEVPDHVCDGSCSGNCQCHSDKPQTVEDKLQGLNGDGMMVIMVEDIPEVQEEQPLDFIQQIAAKIKR